MAEVKHMIERPLSPHLSIYRPQINMVMSIVHRTAGGALYFGTLLLAAWLVAAATGERAFAFVNGLFGHPIGLLIMLGYSWALIHHMLGGLRHLIWDTGRGLDPRSVNILSWLTIVGSLAATAALWVFGLSLRGLSLQDLL
jgi:succinate dehydrogenase / fumarate reductase cytochrome b subunit